MAKHITLFDTQEQYNAFKDSSEYVYPNISYVRGWGSVINKSPSFQTKEVEITENGEIEVKPDAGYGSMRSVNIKTNVPKDSYTYFDCFGERAISDYYSYIGASVYNKSDHRILGQLSKYQDEDGMYIYPSYFDDERVSDGIVATAVNLNTECFDGTSCTLNDMFDGSKHPEISKEEFYEIPKDVVVEYGDREKIKEITDHIFNKLNRWDNIFGKETVARTLNVKGPIPLSYFGYNSIQIKDPEGDGMFTHIFGIGYDSHDVGDDRGGVVEHSVYNSDFIWLNDGPDRTQEAVLYKTPRYNKDAVYGLCGGWEAGHQEPHGTITAYFDTTLDDNLKYVNYNAGTTDIYNIKINDDIVYTSEKYIKTININPSDFSIDVINNTAVFPEKYGNTDLPVKGMVELSDQLPPEPNIKPLFITRENGNINISELSGNLSSDQKTVIIDSYGNTTQEGVIVLCKQDFDTGKLSIYNEPILCLCRNNLPTNYLNSTNELTHKTITLSSADVKFNWHQGTVSCPQDIFVNETVHSGELVPVDKSVILDDSICVIGIFEDGSEYGLDILPIKNLTANSEDFDAGLEYNLETNKVIVSQSEGYSNFSNTLMLAKVNFETGEIIPIDTVNNVSGIKNTTKVEFIINYYDGEPRVGPYMFENCPCLTELILSPEIRSIGSDAISGTNLGELTCYNGFNRDKFAARDCFDIEGQRNVPQNVHVNYNANGSEYQDIFSTYPTGTSTAMY